MSIEGFAVLVRSEKTAFRFLKKLLWKNYVKFCIRCRSYRVYSLESGKYRCGRCGYDFRDFTGRWLSLARLSAKQWLWLVKLFSLEISTRKIARELGISYPSALRAVDAIRMSIIMHGSDEVLKGTIEMDDAYFGGRRKGNRGRGAAGKVPVFGVLERAGKVYVNVVPNMSAEYLMGSAVKKVKRGSIVYTDKWKGYDSLMFCGYRHMKLDHSKQFASGKVHINGMEGFWSYAKERLIKHHGVSKQKFPLYIKEMEFRYNNRQQDIYETLLKYIADLVAKH